MSKVKVLFAFSDGLEIDRLVDWGEGGGDLPCHTGIFLNGYIYEALKQGFVKSSENSYDGRRIKILEVDVPNIEEAEAEAEKLLGTPYGWKACLDGGLHDVLGVTVPGDGEKTVDCSESVTRILQAGGLDIFRDFSADNVTPADLLKKLQKLI
ncbi:MAG: hypothetical protein H6Q73_1839 [Firmicutes bacterium]|nr:hypothetical protein [Bacillota bacterium]